MKGEEHRAARQELGEGVTIALLRRKLERWRRGERRCMGHQNSFTSTSSPASTMSVCAGISM
jgi:hypothetical protein